MADEEHQPATPAPAPAPAPEPPSAPVPTPAPAPVTDGHGEPDESGGPGGPGEAGGFAGPAGPAGPGPGGAGAPGGAGGVAEADLPLVDLRDAPDTGEERRTGWWLPCSCMLVVLGIGMFFVVPVVAFLLFLNRVDDNNKREVRAWFADLRAEDYDGAVGRMCRQQRDSLEPTELGSRIESAGGISEFAIEEASTPDSGEGSVSVTVTDVAGTQHAFHLKLAREDDTWRVCSLP